MEKTFQDLCQAAISNAGYELVRVTWKNHELCFYINQPNGIDHTDCETVTHLIEPIVEQHDAVLGENYSLAVSSVGIDGKDWE